MIVECEVFENDDGSQDVCYIDWRPLRKVDISISKSDDVDSMTLRNLQAMLDDLGWRCIDDAFVKVLNLTVCPKSPSWADSPCFVLFILDRVGSIQDAVQTMQSFLKRAILVLFTRMLGDWPQLARNHAFVHFLHVIASALLADEGGTLELAKACDILCSLLAADSEQLFEVHGAQCELDYLREIYQILSEKINEYENAGDISL